MIPAAEKTGNCEIRADAYVRKIETDAHGRAAGVIYFGPGRREIFQRAKAVIVCANGAGDAAAPTAFEIESSARGAGQFERAGGP